MLKTKYMGYQLQTLRRVDPTGYNDDDRWIACFLDTVVGGKWSGAEVHGHGHTPEAAMADAQKQIKLASKE